MLSFWCDSSSLTWLRWDVLPTRSVGAMGVCRPIMVVETGKVYPSILEAAHALNMRPQRISFALKYACRYGGYHFCYDDDGQW
eukprot:g7621.t1